MKSKVNNLFKILYVFIILSTIYIMHSYANATFYSIIHKDLEKKFPGDNNTYGVFVQHSKAFERTRSQEFLIKGYDKTRYLDSERPMIMKGEPEYEKVRDLVNMGRILSSVQFKLDPPISSTGNDSSENDSTEHEIMYLGEKRSISKSDIISGLEGLFEISVGEKIEE